MATDDRSLAIFDLGSTYNEVEDRESGVVVV